MPVAEIAGRRREVTHRRLARWLWSSAAFLDRRRDRTLILALAVTGIMLAAPGMIKEAQPHSDGLFYEAQVAELTGLPHEVALHNAFSGDRADAVARIEDSAPGVVRVLDPAWVEYSAQFYQRRWLVPALAVGVQAVSSATTATALQIVSMAGYAMIGAAVFALLRRRFPASTSTVVAVICLLCPLLYRWSFGQYVDSWGVLLETLGLLALVLVADRGYRWLPAWVATMAILSVTRDATAVLGVAALALLLTRWRIRSERPLLLWTVVLGGLAAAPALLLGGTPVRQTLAYEYSGSRVPARDDWAYVLGGYPSQLWSTTEANLTFPAKFGVATAAVLYATLLVGAVGLIVAAIRLPRGDVLFTVARGALIGCVGLLLITNFPQGYRLELVLIPVIAIGLAHAINQLCYEKGQHSNVRKR